MKTKTLIIPELKRVLAPPFAWVDRSFLLNGFMGDLSHQENLLYFFLVLVSDRDGLSFYSYDKICQRLKLSVDNYIQARNNLIGKKLIAFDGHQFQVLALPEIPTRQPHPKQQRPLSEPARDAQSLTEIFSQLMPRANREI